MSSVIQPDENNLKNKHPLKLCRQLNKKLLS